MTEERTASLRAHITRSYLNLRLGVVLIGGGLPLALWLIGWAADGHGLLGSMSAYYYSPSARDVFVGALMAVGAILYLYRGFSRAEDWALNLAGFCVVGVAWIPTDPPGSPARLLTWHGGLAVAFFLCIAFVCITRASDTLSLIRDTGEARRFRRIYQGLGWAMVVAPISAAVLGSVLRTTEGPNPTVFFVEAAGVWVFATYWFVKSRELAKTRAAELALEGKLRVAAARSGVGAIVQVEPDELSISDWQAVVDQPGSVGH